MLNDTHISITELEAGLGLIREAPKDGGVLKMIVRRPGVDQREVVGEGELDPGQGLLGDNWNARGSKHMPDHAANPEAQLTLMNARAIALIARNEARWSLAGDQLYVDLDLGEDNLLPGTRLAIGSAVVEVSSLPHTGCSKFSERFGLDALKFVNSPEGRRLHLRGINTKIVRAGTIRVGDAVRKVQG